MHDLYRWTNALLDYRYGREFVYYEMLACSFNLLSCVLCMLCTYTALLSFACPITRWIGSTLKLLPAAGEGPSVQTLNTGFFNIEAVGRTVTGEKIHAIVSSTLGDPGYKETAKMAAEAALTVALQLSSCTPLTGVLSPAAGIGDPLVKRLIAKGITCKVYEQTNTQTPAAAAAAADTQTTKKAL